MFYSCFNPRTGLYDYYTDGPAGIPINGDLPVPKLPSATQIGVPAIDVGRSLPLNVKSVGSGWHARGQIVQCGRGSLGVFNTSNTLDWISNGGWMWLVGGVATIFLVKKVLK